MPGELRGNEFRRVPGEFAQFRCSGRLEEFADQQWSHGENATGIPALGDDAVARDYAAHTRTHDEAAPQAWPFRDDQKQHDEKE